MLRYLVTLQVTDRTGLVEQIAHIVSRHGGHWLDSELRHLDGIFAAILLLEVPAANWETLLENLECIEGLSLTYIKTSRAMTPAKCKHYSLVAYDRPGLVHDISNKISDLGINIEKLSTNYESASHTGVLLFRANFNLNMPDDAMEQKLTQALYSIGDDVVLDVLD
ncbi:ACT domain-containing protein [Shewanella sp. Isolate11]|uniref:glycine cleavage system protein R n=1 Tax=Shewanella sp. Isolate11 TaxID=2908530 RepID=UPI001EFC987D|nr:ACT domain-containing protein [Shewanella sp. Isolate11]MCG9696898.1 amino acid-binding protein [Shewanella sp. Isolate11]